MFKKITIRHKIYIACFAWFMAIMLGHPDMDTVFACGLMFTE